VSNYLTLESIKPIKDAPDYNQFLTQYNQPHIKSIARNFERLQTGFKDGQHNFHFGNLTVGATNYDRLEIADDGVSKGNLTKYGTDDLFGMEFNAYWDGSYHSYDATRHCLDYYMTGSTTTASHKWRIAQPGATPTYALLMQLDESGVLLLGPDVNTNQTTDFPRAKLISSAGDTGQTSSAYFGLIGEANADATYEGRGIQGIGKTSSSQWGYGVTGNAFVNASADTKGAIALYGVASSTHAGGNNYGVYSYAANGAIDYSFYGVGGICHNNHGYTMGTTTRYYVVSAADLIPPDENDLYVYNAGTFISGSATVAITGHAGVHLPHGAIVTNITASVYRDDAASTLTIYLYRSAGYGSALDTMATVSSTSTAGAHTITDSTISNATIDNSAYQYYFHVLLDPNNAATDVQFHKAVITYTITAPLP